MRLTALLGTTSRQGGRGVGDSLDSASEIEILSQHMNLGQTLASPGSLLKCKHEMEGQEEDRHPGLPDPLPPLTGGVTLAEVTYPVEVLPFSHEKDIIIILLPNEIMYVKAFGKNLEKPCRCQLSCLYVKYMFSVNYSQALEYTVKL